MQRVSTLLFLEYSFQLVGLDFLLDIGFDLINELTPFSQPKPGRARDTRKPLRPHHHQRHNANQHQLEEPNVEHDSVFTPANRQEIYSKSCTCRVLPGRR